MHELCLDGVLVKKFKRPAPELEVILSAFQRNGWPPSIKSPFPLRSGQNPKTRVHDAIKRLNVSLKHRFIVFHGDGTGLGVCWELLFPKNSGKEFSPRSAPKKGLANVHAVLDTQAIEYLRGHNARQRAPT